MFRGTAPGVMAVYGDALSEGRQTGRRFVGAEHLLLALVTRGSESGHLLRAAGLSPEAIDDSIDRLAGVPAAVAADLVDAAALGVVLDHAAAVALRSAPPSHGLLPLGWRRGRRWCERASPPIAGDAEAAYESALHLALARWDRRLNEHHLAEVLVRWSRGSRFVVERSGVDPGAALAALTAAHPPRRRVRSGHLEQARSPAPPEGIPWPDSTRGGETW
jgi:hypothetical protein